MPRMECEFLLGPPCAIVEVRAETDSVGYETIRSSVADYQCVVDAQWLTAEGHRLLVTLQGDGRDDEYLRLRYFLRQLGVRTPAVSLS